MSAMVWNGCYATAPVRPLRWNGYARSTPIQLLDRLAALIPPPRKHRHRYYGALAPNSPLRAAVTALAQPAEDTPAPAMIGASPSDATPTEPAHR